jgi:hypothetical protein
VFQGRPGWGRRGVIDNTKLKIGCGLSDTGVYRHAMDMARQLEAAGVWDGQSTVVIHDAYDIHRRVQFTPVEKRPGAVNVNAGIYGLVEGQDYETVARSA